MNKDNTNKDNTNKDNTNKDNTNKDNTDNMNRNEKYELLQNNSKTEGKDRITIEELNKIMRIDYFAAGAPERKIVPLRRISLANHRFALELHRAIVKPCF